jgi:erythronate-4-phosphate dehydrogenase
MAVDRGFSLNGRMLGIVGAGNVGSKVEEKACALGMDVILNDPPLRDKTGDTRYRAIDEIFDADIVSMHVPLTAEGEYPTYHMIDRDFLSRMGDGKGLINSSRGGVADSTALAEKLEKNGFLFCACDVWENEPDINPEIAEQTDICTPHIAGYSFEGKVKGTYIIYLAACEYSDTEPEWDYRNVLGRKQEYSVRFSGTFEENILEAVRYNYSVRDDDRDLRKALITDDIGSSFDSLRRNYRTRREFTHSVVACPGSAEQSQTDTLELLGFEVMTQE